jgi:hypothetical protein
MTQTFPSFGRRISAEHATLYISAGITAVWLASVIVISAM